MYLKDHSPYLDSSLPYSNSQNIIRVNLLSKLLYQLYLYCLDIVNYSIPTYLAY
jgi:hypothetical protein